MYSSQHNNLFHILWLVFLVVYTLVPWMVQVVEGQGENLENEIPRLSRGSCAGKCCKGRNSSCVVQVAQLNAIIEDVNDVPCYCDNDCLKLQDCCSDFKESCGVQDCQLSNWGLWGHCDVNCVMTRSRTILTEPRNGGQPCSSLFQQRGCRGMRCHQIPNRIHFEDTAIILPVEFSAKRNQTSDHLTRNLRLRYPKNPAKEKSKDYCVEFQVFRSTRACKHMASFVSLYEGNHVCVRCDKQAQRAYLGWKCSGGTETENGRSGRLARFYSLREPNCHGIWKHISTQVRSGPDLVCPCPSDARFIFV